jgi:hypothetical protein
LEEPASLEWPHTPGTITASFTKRTCDSYRTLRRWEARIAYRYSMAGIEHRGQRVAGTAKYCNSEREDVTQ